MKTESVMVIVRDTDIRKKISEAFKDTVLEKDVVLQTRVLDLVVNERWRAAQVAIGHKRFATSSMDEVAKEIAEGEHEIVRRNGRKNGEDSN